MDLSTMTEAWWLAGVASAASLLHVTCRRCTTSSTPSVRTALGRKGVGCDCVRRAPKRVPPTDRASAMAWLDVSRFDGSIMTEEWWAGAMKNTRSKLQATCRTCGFEDRSLSLKNFQAGARFDCPCRGDLPGAACRARFAELFERRGLDASLLSADAWAKTASDGAEALLPVRCCSCGAAPAVGVTVRSFLEDAPSSRLACACSSANLRWNTLEGRDECLAILRRTCPRLNLDAMSEAWWLANVTGCHSKILATCSVCRVVCSATTLSNLKKGQGVPCGCSRREYRGPEGRAVVLAELGQPRHERWDASAMTEAWYDDNVQGSTSKLTVQCRVCEYVNDRVVLQDVMNGKNIGCFCRGGVPWSSEAGRQQILRLLAEHQPNVCADAMTTEWWAGNVRDSFSKLVATCSSCGYESRDTAVQHFLQRKRIGCICNKGVNCCEDAYRIWFLRLLDARQPDLDAASLTAEWWAANIHHHKSLLTVFCKACKEWCATTTLNNAVQRGGSVRCGYALKTEAKLLHFLRAHAAVVARQAGDCINPATGHKLPFDFGVPGGFVELDGPSGHFGWNFFTRTADEAFPRRDLFKEEWAIERGFYVVRLLSRDVWLDTGDWKRFVLAALEEMREGKGPPRVIVPAASEYRSGIYAELRAASADDAAHKNSSCAEQHAMKRRRMDGS